MRASDLLSVNVLMALDLPALERPAKATSFPVSGGQFFSLGALVKNFAWRKFNEEGVGLVFNQRPMWVVES